jgi:ubiquinone biosynthesis protein COQ4
MNSVTQIKAKDDASTLSPSRSGMVLEESARRYMQGDVEPAKSSVLTSNSIYLSNPYYRDAFAHQALRRHGHDLPPTYVVPMMIKAIAEVSDFSGGLQLLAEEKAKNPEFGAWLNARKETKFRAENLGDYAEGTLGAAIRAFLEAGYDQAQGKKDTPVTSDFEYQNRQRLWSHDIEHLVTGFGADTAGEAALALCNVGSFARYFTPALAQTLSHGLYWISAGGLMRTSLHYHHVIPTYLDAMQQGIAAGLVIKRPLFMENWEAYLGWQLEDIAAHLGFQRGPGAAWAWTTEAASG